MTAEGALWVNVQGSGAQRLEAELWVSVEGSEVQRLEAAQFEVVKVENKLQEWARRVARKQVRARVEVGKAKLTDQEVAGRRGHIPTASGSSIPIDSISGLTPSPLLIHHC